MFKRLKLRRKIKKCKKTITFIEKKRARSQAALVEAILANAVPNDEDVDYFNKFTAQITEERDKLHQYQKELSEI